MMGLDEAIQHCLEVAEKQEKMAENNMNIQIKKYKVYDADEYIEEIDGMANHYLDLVKTDNNGYGFLGNGRDNCLKFATKQKRLAGYLKDYKKLLKERIK